VVSLIQAITLGAALREQGWQHWETQNHSAMLAAFRQAIQATSQDAKAWTGADTCPDQSAIILEPPTVENRGS